MRVFVSGPYSHPTEEGRLQNTRKAMQAAVALIHRGHTVFCPHLSHFLDTLATEMGMPVSYEQWMEQDLGWLATCDALLFLGDSPGARRERTLAESLRIPVYFSVAEIPRG